LLLFCPYSIAGGMSKNTFSIRCNPTTLINQIGSKASIFQ
jgi:hypothetical protein